MLKFLIIFTTFLTSSIYASNQCFECNGHPDVPHYARNPRGCAWFFLCNPGDAPLANRCPEPYLFNYEKQICDYPENVDCVDAKPLLECPAKGIARIPHPDACSKFVLCFDGQQQDRDCQPGLHFSAKDGRCIAPNLAECKTDVSFCDANSEVITFPKIASSRRCNNYYICSNQHVVPQECAYDWHFSPSTGFCGDSDEAECDDSEVLEDLDFIPNEIDFDCSAEVDGSAHSIANSCDFWYICASGTAYIQRCGEGAIFDVNQLRCVARSVDESQCATDEVPETRKSSARQMLRNFLNRN